MAGDARAEEREPRRGKHRRGSDGATWTPEVPRAVDPPSFAAPTTTIPAPREPGRGVEPVAYALPETGLRKFNLGTIPASVTPPRTWRRAAWFAVGTSAFVVCALGFAAYALVGSPRKGTTIEGLPGQPTQQLLITDLPADTTEPSPRVASTSAPPPTSRTSSSATRPQHTREVAARATGPGEVATARPGVPGTPGRPATPGPATPPPRSTVEALTTPPTDPRKMGDRTEQYFAQVVKNPAGACQLTAGPMRAEGPEGIEARYADVERIEVKEILIDPNWSYTRSVLVLVRKDGSTTRVRRELTFSQGKDPKIIADNAA
jgi:hypothetical protein